MAGAKEADPTKGTSQETELLGGMEKSSRKMEAEGRDLRKMGSNGAEKSAKPLNLESEDVAPKAINLLEGHKDAPPVVKPPVPAQRHVQGRVYDISDQLERKELKQAFQADKENLLKVWIGELEEGAIVAPPIDLRYPAPQPAELGLGGIFLGTQPRTGSANQDADHLQGAVAQPAHQNL